MTTELLTKKELATAFRVSERTVDAWVAQKILPSPIKLGTAQQARVRFPADSIAFAQERIARKVRP
jgi:predicted DNA-binding transcriptional regulator AlpA